MGNFMPRDGMDKSATFSTVLQWAVKVIDIDDHDRVKLSRRRAEAEAEGKAEGKSEEEVQED